MDYQEVKNWVKKPELKSLLDLTTPPKHLYYQGHWDSRIFDNCVAIVGARRMTLYGEKVIEKLTLELLAKKYTIVSGFMYGVDQYAHEICVQHGGRAIAVLGWGITKPLAGADAQLAKKIIKNGGLLISEWENQLGAHWTFPARNRIVAALSKKVYVVEAALQSGSLITARLALTLHKELWAVPGPITSRTSLGTNTLIAQRKARMWLGEETAPLAPTKGEDSILPLLDKEALSVDELYRKLQVPVSEIGARLSVLLLQGFVSEKEGKYYLNHVS